MHLMLDLNKRFPFFTNQHWIQFFPKNRCIQFFSSSETHSIKPRFTHNFPCHAHVLDAHSAQHPSRICSVTIGKPARRHCSHGPSSRLLGNQMFHFLSMSGRLGRLWALPLQLRDHRRLTRRTAAVWLPPHVRGIHHRPARWLLLRSRPLRKLPLCHAWPQSRRDVGVNTVDKAFPYPVPSLIDGNAGSSSSCPLDIEDLLPYSPNSLLEETHFFFCRLVLHSCYKLQVPFPRLKSPAARAPRAPHPSWKNFVLQLVDAALPPDTSSVALLPPLLAPPPCNLSCRAAQPGLPLLRRPLQFLPRAH